MIWVLEGPNYVGKTTVATALGTALRLPVFADPGRHGALPLICSRDWVLAGIQRSLDFAGFSRHFDFVADRWTLSSTVYDGRRGAVWPDGTLRRVVELAQAKVFLLLARPETLLARSRRDRPEVRTLAEAEDLLRLYRRAAEDYVAIGGELHVIDAEGSAEEVLRAIRAHG